MLDYLPPCLQSIHIAQIYNTLNYNAQITRISLARDYSKRNEHTSILIPLLQDSLSSSQQQFYGCWGFHNGQPLGRRAAAGPAKSVTSSNDNSPSSSHDRSLESVSSDNGSDEDKRQGTKPAIRTVDIHRKMSAKISGIFLWIIRE